MNAVTAVEPESPARPYRLWLPLPLTIVWVLLAPAAMVVSMFAWVVPKPYRVNGPAAALAIGGVLFALSGTRIEVKTRDADIFILIV